MKVLHTECGLNWGGQEFRTLLECQWLNEHGHHAWIMCHPQSEMFNRCQQMGFESVIPMDLKSSWRVDRWLHILWIVWSKKIDLINSHGSKDSMMCILPFLLGVPLLRSRQVTNPVKKRFSYQFCCSHIIAAAQAIKDSLSGLGVDKDKITVIGEGVDVEEFAPRPRPSCLVDEFDIVEDDQIVVNIGMVRKDKGQQFLVEAAKKLVDKHPRLKVFIIGESTRKRPLKQELIEMVRNLGIESQVIFTGYRDDVADFINLADLVVVASTGTEAQSRIVPQSFASQKTVVSTSTGGLTELVDHEANGLVVPPADAEAMARAISRLLDDQTLRSALAEKAYLFAIQALSIEVMMEKTLKLYRRFYSK